VTSRKFFRERRDTFVGYAPPSIESSMSRDGIEIAGILPISWRLQRARVTGKITSPSRGRRRGVHKYLLRAHEREDDPVKKEKWRHVILGECSRRCRPLAAKAWQLRVRCAHIRATLRLISQQGWELHELVSRSTSRDEPISCDATAVKGCPPGNNVLTAVGFR